LVAYGPVRREAARPACRLLDLTGVSA